VGPGAVALAWLAPQLSEPLLREALAAVQAMEHEWARAPALTRLVPYLSEFLRMTALQEALAAARAIQKERDRTQVLTALMPLLEHLPAVVPYPLWCETLHILASRARSNLLLDIQVLSSVLALLGGKEVLDAIAQAIIEVGKWFP
jgi:hypothetical protein